MAKSIEKIIEDSVVPDMEYVKTKHKAQTVEEEVPEVVLPKTKAEMYEEAKGRLEQKTSAVSKAYRPGKKNERNKRVRVKTVELDSAAAAVEGAKSIEEREDTEKIKTRLHLRKPVDDPKWVGSADELIPFAWRAPLVEVSRPTKYYKTAVIHADRGKLLPAPRSK